MCVLLLWNFTYSLRVISWPCLSSPITLNRILTEFSPFRLKNLGYTFECKLVACKFFSLTKCMLLLWNFTHLTRVIRWLCMPSPITLDEILTQLCPFLDLRILVKPLRARHLRHCVCCWIEILHTSILGHAIIILGRPSYEETRAVLSSDNPCIFNLYVNTWRKSSRKC